MIILPLDSDIREKVGENNMKHPVDDLLQRLYHNSDQKICHREFEAAEARWKPREDQYRTRQGLNGCGRN